MFLSHPSHLFSDKEQNCGVPSKKATQSEHSSLFISSIDTHRHTEREIVY